ncbi:baseplate multidomain protein megatron [Aestuariivita boseongensis]|uniref:baseplate multidomain protein megatron n=1 Tax=Aestuariivita boseongensis TaxID=1470562 RepID=UPI00068234C6|nr:glycoside hydrolase/phage tail family protein [Aestuariivita boseongensis]
MATLLLSAAGAAIGGSIGGTVLGLSSVAIGRAVGATIGKAIDQRLLGSGSDPVEVGRVDRFRLTGASEGTAIARSFGRVRLGGQVIWASDFLETVATSGGGGKGRPPQPQVTQFSYTVSLAIALCEGEISSVSRVWADGEEVSLRDLNMTVYTGSDDQLPDPLMEAVEGAGQVPAYRGTAYVVMEAVDLGRFGNRVPQFSFEITRPISAEAEEAATSMPHGVKGVALVPGTGEYALATTPVYYSDQPGSTWAANLNSPSGLTDFETSFTALREEAPNCEAASLVVCWFGDDLRCGSCTLVPKVETDKAEGQAMPWSVSGLSRGQADVLEEVDGRPVYGGTPADASVVEAIRHMRDAGKRVLFYPFILMDQVGGNGLPDPYSGATDQPALPWRGRITLSTAPGRPGSPDGTAQADQEVADFFGTAQASDFIVGNGVVTYVGNPNDWGMRRFILHYAALCAAAGGIDSFAIGTEMRGLTWIRGAGNAFTAVEQFRALAAEVRVLLPEAQIGYAADWSEYFGYQPQDGSGDRYFHLDPLWGDANIDFVGIDNYIPLSDWREGRDHADAALWPSIYDLDYLKANIQGGEGYDWFYHSAEAREAQIRTPIEDGAGGEPWIYRYKDIRNWWENAHFERVGGVRSQTPTAWEPRSKPIWFTELGCGAVDKGTNQPNKFLDPKSSESSLPLYSNGQRDDFIQAQYLRAMYEYWGMAENNPEADLYAGRMVDMANAYVWAWDTRPFPFFPNNLAQWSDGLNYLRGHWINGRVSSRSLASVVAEICERAGVAAFDVSALKGMVRGYGVDQVADGRSELQPLMLAYGFDAVERDGRLIFQMRGEAEAVPVEPDLLAMSEEIAGGVARARETDAELAGRVRLRFVETEGDHAIQSEEAVPPDEATHAVSSSETALALTRGEARRIVERWLIESRVARDTIRFALPPSRLDIGAGDIVSIPGTDGLADEIYRVDRVEQAGSRVLDAVRIEPSVYDPASFEEGLAATRAFVPPVPVQPLFLDLPLITGDEVPHAPHLATTASPWPGSVAVWSSDRPEDFRQDLLVTQRSVIGRTKTQLSRARPGVWDNGAALEVELLHGALESRPLSSVLNGANLAAIGDGTPGNWELFQFQTADVIGPGTYWLSGRLRGQLGSDALMPDLWPEGSWVVLLNGAPEQIPLSAAERRIAKYFRIGPALRPVDDPSYVERVEAFDGNGLRPLSPVHLRTTQDPGGALDLSWIRRTRVDGDSWDVPEVPLGEEREAYLVRVFQNDTLLREVEVTAPAWRYELADQTADGAAGALRFEVAQISARYGAGLFGRVTAML